MSKILCFLRRFVYVFMIMLFIIISFFAGHFVISAYADSSLSFDKTNVLDDLKSSTVNGKPFDINKFPFDGSGEVKHPTIVNFVEYCYSYKVNMQENYGLYVYFYNPQGLNIDVTSKSNSVQMAVKYDTSIITTDSIAQDFEKFDLQFCSKSHESKYANLFYKFKIIDHKSADGKNILKRVNSNERRYDISGIELQAVNAPILDYTVGGTYYFSGYAKGYGADSTAVTDLTSRVVDLETIRLDVRDAVYRTQSSDVGLYHQNQLNSVYFALDNEILSTYGKLQKIKAEWYEYKTQPIIAMSDVAVYNNLLDCVGVPIVGDFDTSVSSKLYGAVIDRGDHQGAVKFNWSYNGYTGGSAGNFPCFSTTKEKVLYNVLPILPQNIDNRFVTSAQLSEYFYGYNKTFNKGVVDTAKSPISADLFLDEVDSGRKRAKNTVNIDAGDRIDLFSFKNSASLWDKIGHFGLWDAIFKGDPTDTDVSLLPIVDVKDSDILGDVNKNLFLDPSYVNDFKAYYQENKLANKTTFLFRFAATDYYSFNVHNSLGSAAKDERNGYFAQETVFLNFDILQLTFNKDGVYHVIPVVSNPIDIISALTPPIDFVKPKSWLAIILIAVVILLIVILIAPILPHIFTFVVQAIFFIFKLLWKIICLPFTTIKLIASKAKKKKE